MPKVLFGVSSSYCANFLKGQLLHWRDKGFDVIVISGPGPEITKLCKDEKARLYEIPFTKKITPFTDLFHLRRIYHILKKEKPDIINAGNPKSGLLIMLAARMVNTGYRIFTLHGLYSDGQHGFKKWLITKAEKLATRYAHRIIAVSESLKKHAVKRKIIPADITVVPAQGSFNGIDLVKFKLTADVMQVCNEFKSTLNISATDWVIGYAGRLTKDKGVEYLLSAFYVLKQKYPNLKLFIAGPVIPENPLSDTAMQQIYSDDNIIYPGTVDNMPTAYALMQVLVLPSIREGFPGVLLEAAAMEVPVIASEIPGCIDAVSNEINGLLFPAGNVNALVQTLEKLITSDVLRRQYGMNGRKFVEDSFSNQVVWNAHEEIYKEALLHKGTA